MDLKINNFYYCKKDLCDGILILEKHKHYKVIYLHHAELILVCDSSDFIMSFDINSKFSYFYDYFYTTKEERVQKLKKIYATI